LYNGDGNDDVRVIVVVVVTAAAMAVAVVVVVVVVVMITVIVSGAYILGARSPRRLNFVQWCLIFMSSQYET
jgi:hypothetical protein